MNVTFYSDFSKKPNSTKRPAGGVTKNVLLKEETSLRSPTFKLTDDGTTYSYCMCAGLYYYISDKRFYPNNVVEYDCTLDLLATNRASILNLNCYIERCSQINPNLMLTDGYNNPSNEILTASTDLIDTGDDHERFVLVVTGANGVVAFNLNLTQSMQLFKAISEHDFDDTQANKVMEYVVSFKRVPYTSTGSTQTIMLGNYNTGVTATKIGVPHGLLVDSNTYTLNFPSSEYCGAKNYTDFSPYTSGALYLPYVGIVSLDIDLLSSSRIIGLSLYRNDMTGDLVYKIDDGNKIISTYSGNCAQNIPLTALVNDAWGVKQAHLQTIGGALTTLMGLGALTVASGGAAAPALLAGASSTIGGILTTASSIQSSQKAAELHAQTNGSISSNLGYWLGSVAKAIIFTKKPCYPNLVEINERYGLPYEKVGTVNAVDGGSYIKTKNCTLTGCVFDTANQTRLIVDSGIYLE